MEIIIKDNPDDKDLQEFKRGLEELKNMSPEERRLDARWILLNSDPLIWGSQGIIYS